MLTLNPNSAKQADVISQAIKESGKYIGTITRAEKLVSKKGTPGLGLSFKTDAGESADYLDLYIGETDGKPWGSTNTVNAILCCIGLREATDGKVKIDRYNKESKTREQVVVDGYPEIQGKRIGLLLQKELTEYEGKQQEKLLIYGVFAAETEMTSSEILARATKPEKLEKMVQSLMARPVKDSRTHAASAPSQNEPTNGGGFADFDAGLPF